MRALKLVIRDTCIFSQKMGSINYLLFQWSLSCSSTCIIYSTVLSPLSLHTSHQSSLYSHICRLNFTKKGKKKNEGWNRNMTNMVGLYSATSSGSKCFLLWRCRDTVNTCYAQTLCKAIYFLAAHKIRGNIWRMRVCGFFFVFFSMLKQWRAKGLQRLHKTLTVSHSATVKPFIFWNQSKVIGNLFFNVNSFLKTLKNYSRIVFKLCGSPLSHRLSPHCFGFTVVYSLRAIAPTLYLLRDKCQEISSRTTCWLSSKQNKM